MNCDTKYLENFGKEIKDKRKEFLNTYHQIIQSYFDQLSKN